MQGLPQVEMAALEYRASRLVRTLDPITGKRGGFGEGSEVVSARCLARCCILAFWCRLPSRRKGAGDGSAACASWGR